MKLWKYRCLGGLSGIGCGGLLLLALTSCDAGPIGDAAEAMRDRAGFDQARQQLLDRQKPQSIQLAAPRATPVLDVMHDDANGVTCWARTGYVNTTLSCLPDWMLSAGERPPLAGGKCLVKDVGKSEACRQLFADIEPQAPADTWPTGRPCHGDATCIAIAKHRRALESAQ